MNGLDFHMILADKFTLWHVKMIEDSSLAVTDYKFLNSELEVIEVD